MVDVTVILPLLKGNVMPTSCPTVKVKPWAESQGDFVEINEEDFDAEIHTLYNEAEKPAAVAKPAKAAKAEKPAAVEPEPAPVADPNKGWN